MSDRRLILMRHAKSSWAEGSLSDHDRPLNGRGRKAAVLMGEELARLGWVPDRVISSTAQRTRETWGLMEESLGEGLVEFAESLYLGGLRDIRKHARRWEPDWETVLVLGHNPGWSDAASALSGRNIAMTTANCVLLHGEGGSWREALEGDWSLEALLRPRDL